MLKPLADQILETYAPEPKYGRAFAYDPPIDLAHFSAFTGGQPFDALKTMRENAPVCWCKEPPELGGGFWALTRYDDVRAVSLNPQIFSSQKGGILMAYGNPAQRHPVLHRASLDQLINMDQPIHFELRREHLPFFTAKYVADLKLKVEAKVTALLDDIALLGKCDLVEHLSAELPLFTLSEILGIPESDRPKLVRWMHYLEIAGYVMAEKNFGAVDPNFFGEFMSNVAEMFEYGRDVLLKRRAEPKQDLLTALAHAKVGGDLMPDNYLDGSWLLIVFAGNDTTRNSISGTMKLLTEFAAEKTRVQASLSLLPTMVDEAIRMVSPVMYMRRTATKDTEIRGQMIAEGEKVIMYYGAANRDPEVFPDPDRFDASRTNGKDHVAFGIGPHVCLGQRVANMQLEAVYRQILTRFPDMRWTGEIDIAPNNFVHAIRKLGVEFTPEKKRAA
ncbi:MAG: cytochrome P450 [Alphaproteobacteria bacterium]|nr:cytochrome P450 [Alphaproteobacteria bacterium]